MTVTAYNRQYQVLHRGTVLHHDAKRHFYLIQFERKELGFEVCPDHRISAHGLQLPVCRAPDTAFDGTHIGGSEDLNKLPGSIVYGTGYGGTPVGEYGSLFEQRHV